LANKVGVTRQTIYAIEAGTYLPNTEVTLRLARQLEVSVEELFSLPGEQQEESATVTAEYLGNQFDPTLGVQRIYWSKNFKLGLPFSNASQIARQWSST